MKTPRRMRRWTISLLVFVSSCHVSFIIRFSAVHVPVSLALHSGMLKSNSLVVISTYSLVANHLYLFTHATVLLLVMETQYSGDTVLLVFPDGTGPALLSAMIAGIPFNRVHEMNLRPAEIRLDVNMKSIKALLNSGTLPTEEYKTTLAQGRQELKRLRSMKSADIISVKDQKLEEDRLESEAAATERETKRLAKEEEDQLARETRAHEIQEERLRLRELNGNGSGDTNPVLLGTSVVGATAAAVAVLSDKGEDKKETMDVEVTNATGLNAQITEHTDLDILDDLVPVFAGGRNVTDGLGQLSSDNDVAEEAVRQRVNGDRLATFPPPRKPRDPVKAAEEAMKEYMDSDDGGSEWLQVMSELALEEDEGDMDEQPPGLRP